MFWRKLWLLVGGRAGGFPVTGKDQTQRDQTQIDNAEVENAWCAVANVVMEREYGPGGVEKRSGTKHFPAGSKVYILHHFWGMGGERVTVVGRHRGSHRYVTMTISSEWLANWRTELVYSPHIIRLIKTCGEYSKYSRAKPGGEAAKSRAEEIVAMWRSSGAKEQPFLARTSDLEPEPPAAQQCIAQIRTD